MVQKTFSVYHPTDEQYRLFIEVGQQQVACWTMEDDTNIIHNFELFEFEVPTKSGNFEVIFKEIKVTSHILKGSHVATHIIWENDQCVTVPSQYYNDQNKNAFLNILLGDYAHALIQESELENTHFVYRIAEEKCMVLQNYFPLASSIHKYQALFNTTIHNTTSTEDYIRLSFYRHHFILTLVKNNTLQLIQSFAYQTPEDVLYFVLNTCKQYDLNTQTIQVLVSGLIDREDSVYGDLQQFLNNLQVEEMNNVYMAPAFTQYPSHYFSSFFKMMI